MLCDSRMHMVEPKPLRKVTFISRNKSMAKQEYFYDIVVGDVYTKNGDPLPPVTGQVNQFMGTTEKALGKFVEMGYNLMSYNGLFTDNGERFVSETFKTTPASNSRNYVPDRLGQLMKESPYKTGLFAQIPIGDLRFGSLTVNRTIQPKMGGKRKSRKISRKAHRKARKSRRTSRH
jgi:hypothetical protein